MKFIYEKQDNLPDTLNKYDIDFPAGDAVEVTDVNKIAKLQKSPYLSVVAEEAKPKRTRRTPEQMKAAKEAENVSDKE